MHKLIFLTVIALSLTACKGEKETKNVTTEKPAVAELKKPQIIKADPIELLRTHLSLTSQNQPQLSEQAFAKIPLSKEQAKKATEMILADRLAILRTKRRQEFDEKVIRHGDKTMRYEFMIFGDAPHDGRSLYISMHGGGNTAARVNDGQWRNQIRLYRPAEGIYLAPRAPTNTWDLWHQNHIDPMFDRLIENFITFKGVNPNKVYIMGYSAGGDGTYQLAPRMADRWAGAAMMAGHPGDAQTWNLRNLAYIIQCGGKDHAYNRAKLCAEWGKKLGKLAKADPGGYPHKAIVYPQHGHWMSLECKQALPWMAKHTRNPWPKKLHWYQDNVTHTRYFWLSNKNPKHKQLISAEVKENTITLTLPATHNAIGEVEFTDLDTITLRLNDRLLDLDKPVIIKDEKGAVLLEKEISRDIQSIHNSLHERLDSTSVATATVTVRLKKP